MFVVRARRFPVAFALRATNARPPEWNLTFHLADAAAELADFGFAFGNAFC
jgi:hypothetical protein